MIRFFDMFLGRSTAMRALDDALQTAGLHPLLVPEPVKLTVIQLTKKFAAAQVLDAAFANAAQLAKPDDPQLLPDRAALVWHNEQRFNG
ncbi:MAG: hypothetical protein IKD58_04140 [Loktanella sp.]|nr:hypothetical protein [Loktanella sp.]